MNPPRSIKATPPYAWFSKEMLGHIDRKLSEDRYVDQALAIRAHYFTLCQICSNRGGHPTFPARISEIAQLTCCSIRTTKPCLQALAQIHAIVRSRGGAGDSYMYTLLALSEDEETGGATIAPGGAIERSNNGGQLHRYKKKEENKGENKGMGTGVRKPSEILNSLVQSQKKGGKQSPLNLLLKKNTDSNGNASP